VPLPREPSRRPRPLTLIDRLIHRAEVIECWNRSLKSNKAIFFKGTEHASFNMSNTPAEEVLDAGFPKTIMGFYPGLQF
jgi:hypothetical protein